MIAEALPYSDLYFLFIDTPEHESIVDIITNKRRIKDVRQLSPHGQTSSLEAFHSVVNHFAPKMLHFPYEGMETR